MRLIVATPLGPQSLTPAVAILAAADPVAAWDAHVDGRPVASQVDGQALVNARAWIAGNNQVRIQNLDNNDLGGVPFLLYRDTASGKIGYQRGISAADVDKLVSSISDLRAQAPQAR